MLRALLGIVALGLACIAGPAQADTAASGSTHGVSGVLFNDCLDYPYRYSLSIPADAQDWYLEVTLLGPDQQVAETDRVAPADPVGTSSFFLCTRPGGFGTYTIRSTLHWLGPDADSVWAASDLADSAFTLRKPATRTSVSASTRRPRHGQLVTYRISTLDERPTGFGANAFAWVHLEKRSRGHWVRMKGGRGMTHSTGRVRLKLRYSHHRDRMRIRAVTEPTVRYAGSTSPVLRIW